MTTDNPTSVKFPIKAWAKVPAMHCKGLCQDSCGPIEASSAERALLAERGIELPDIAVALSDDEYVCPALVDGRCTVHDVRPVLCRLWGAVEEMPCPWGCVPVGGRLASPEGLAILGEVMGW